jgi:subtilisin family serine protease
MKQLSGIAAGALVVLIVVTAAPTSSVAQQTDRPPRMETDSGSALVVLIGEPLATYEKTRPPKGRKIDFSSTAVKSYRSLLAQRRSDFRQWLQQNAPAARVTGEFDISLNAVAVRLNGERLETIASAPMVSSARYQGVYVPNAHEDPDLSLLHTFEAWNASAATGAKGKGVKVAIVDTGIDVTHPCFSDGNPQNDGPFTNDKVVVAEVHNNQAGSRGHTPADLNGHGTHVAGTVACNEHTQAIVDGVSVSYDVSGVAPEAMLGNFNVFPGSDGDARSEDIVDALESAYEHGFDIANMSLGGASSGIDDLLARAVDNLDSANMVIAIAAGNSGPGFSTIESPGKAARALTNGAYSVGHFIAASVLSGALSKPAVSGDFATVTVDTTAPLGVVLPPAGHVGAATPSGLSNACSALAGGSLTGRIALISRGVCTFSEKIRNAQNAGAIVALVVNNVGGDAVAMGLGGIPNEPTIPAYMVSLADGTALKANNGVSTTITASRQYFQTPNSNLIAGFSSWGPTDVDFRVKPDVVNPGVNVLSAQPKSTCKSPPCWAFFQGTSMASPHGAGIAALVRGQHPAWSAAEVRSAIVNTADDDGEIRNTTGSAAQLNANIIGAGRANAQAAVDAKVALDPVSVSFGAVSSGSGRSERRTVSLSSLGGTATSVTIDDYAVYGANGARIPTVGGVLYTATLAGGTITIDMNAARGATKGGHQATLRVSAGGVEIAHAVVYTLIK